MLDRARRREAIAEFARTHAGTCLDFDPDLEASSVEGLLSYFEMDLCANGNQRSPQTTAS